MGDVSTYSSTLLDGLIQRIDRTDAYNPPHHEVVYPAAADNPIGAKTG
jgi:hypothetical protein